MEITIDQWNKDPNNAKRLAELLKDETLKAALSIVFSSSMANSFAKGQVITESNHSFYLGYDTGRARLKIELNELATPAKEKPTQIEPTYE